MFMTKIFVNTNKKYLWRSNSIRIFLSWRYYYYQLVKVQNKQFKKENYIMSQKIWFVLQHIQNGQIFKVQGIIQQETPEQVVFAVYELKSLLQIQKNLHQIYLKIMKRKINEDLLFIFLFCTCVEIIKFQASSYDKLNGNYLLFTAVIILLTPSCKIDGGQAIFMRINCSPSSP